MLIYMKLVLTWLRRTMAAGLVVSLLSCSLLATVAADPAFPPETSTGSIGLQGTISTAAPTTGATIATPSNGATFTALPVTVAGLCPSGLLVKIFSNNVFVGSVYCSGGSYSIQVDLFSGENDLVARVYDALDQSGPDSNTVTVNFKDVQFIEFGTHVSLSSDYAERGAPPGQVLTWPVTLSGGTSPYAVSVDWGDGTATDLISQPTQGTITLSHTYKTAGIYKVIVKATDKNGGEAFLQLVGVATGATQSNSKGGSSSAVIETKVLWWPAVAMLPLVFAAFWVGRRHELYTLRKQLEKSRDREGR
jgi:hypothetical protein